MGKSGEIVHYQVQRVADRMGVKVVYNQNCHLVELPENFDRMLKEWYDQRLFDVESSEAQDILVDVLEYSHCSKKIVSRIKDSLESPSSFSSTNQLRNDRRRETKTMAPGVSSTPV